MDWRTSHEDVPPHILRMSREEEQALLAYEEPGCDGVDRSVSPEKAERLVDFMLGEDYSTFDQDGWVR